LQPQLSAVLQGKVRDAKGEMQDELVTKLPDDAPTQNVPWANAGHWKKRTPPGIGQIFLEPKQRSGVAFGREHPHFLLADDPGAGKTIEAISTVIEAAWDAT